MAMVELKAPFPYFGGKSTVSKLIWERLWCSPHCNRQASLFDLKEGPPL